MSINQLFYHHNLSSYFTSQPLYLDEAGTDKPNIRKLVEQPWQQTKGEMWGEVTITLCDVFFIEARAKARLLDMQQTEYNEVLSLIPESENKTCLDDFYTVFMQQKHILKEYPVSTFQQLYNELQWKKHHKTKSIIENFRNEFLSQGRFFLHQYRLPEILSSHLKMTHMGKGSAIYYCAFSPDCKQIVSAQMDDKTIIIRDVETGRIINTLKGHNNDVGFCEFSPDGKRIVSEADGVIKLWDVDSGKELKSISGTFHSISPYIFSSDKEHFISQSKDGYLQFWDLETGGYFSNLELNVRYSLAFSPDKKFCVVDERVNSSIVIKDSMTRNVSVRIIGSKPGVKGINTCLFSPDGKYLLTGYYNVLNLWDTKTGLKLYGLPGHTGLNVNCSFSSNNSLLVTVSNNYRYNDNTLRIWDVKTGKELAKLTDHASMVTTCSFSLDNKKIISGSLDGNIKIWDVNPKNECANLKMQSQIECLAFSPNGKIIASTGEDMALKLWDRNTGKEIRTLFGHKASINYCEFSPDSKCIISGSSDKTLFIWNVRSGKKIKVLKFYNSVTSCCFSPDGKRFISCQYGDGSDGMLELWDAVSGRKIKVYIEGGENFCFSPDGKWIISKRKDGSSRIQDSQTGKIILTLRKDSVFSQNVQLIVKEISNISHVNEIVTLKGSVKSDYINYFPDENSLSIFHGIIHKILDLQTNKEISSCQYFTSASIKVSSLSSSGNTIACVDENANFYLLKLEGCDLSLPIITRVRLFRHSYKVLGIRIGSKWDKDITANCPYCGVRFRCSFTFNTTDDDYRLLSECPECGQKIKFNPIVFDNSIKDYSNLEKESEESEKKFFEGEERKLKELYNKTVNEIKEKLNQAECAFNNQDWEAARHLYAELTDLSTIAGIDHKQMIYKVGVCMINKLPRYFDSFDISQIEGIAKRLRALNCIELAEEVTLKLSEKINKLKIEEP